MDERKRASRLEILGTWLHLWTAPRDVYVPPVPWRKVGAGAAVLALLGAVVALVIAPAIEESKDESAAEQRRIEQREKAARVAAQRREQRAVRGRATSLTQVEQAIGTDAQRRFGTDGRAAECDPVPRVPDLYDCHVTVRELVSGGEQEGAQGALTIPYRARLDTERGRYAFCKTNPRPGEQAIGRPEEIVELPRVCAAV